MPSRTTKPISWNEQAQADTDRARARYGFSSDSEAVRVGLHILAHMELTVNIPGLMQLRDTVQEDKP